MAGAPRTTFDANRRAFHLFLSYFATMMRSDAIDGWNRSDTLGLVEWMENEANQGRGFARLR